MIRPVVVEMDKACTFPDCDCDSPYRAAGACVKSAQAAERAADVTRAWDDLPAALKAHPGIKALHRAAVAALPAAPAPAARVDAPDERTAFEAWAIEQWGRIEGVPDAAWLGWQGRATAPAAAAVPVPPAIVEAVRAYHLALDRREHGGVAADRCLNAIQQALGMPWVQGAALAGITQQHGGEG